VISEAKAANEKGEAIQRRAKPRHMSQKRAQSLKKAHVIQAELYAIGTTECESRQEANDRANERQCHAEARAD
jgi:hypothetical protein